jgi:hypothetical protein
MLNSALNYLQIYISRPTVVMMDMFLLVTGVGVFVGVMLLKRKVDNLNVVLNILKNRLEK